MDFRRPFRLATAATQLLFRKRHPPVGSMPGTLVTQPDAEPPVIRLIHYGPDFLEERVIEDPEALGAVIGAEGVSWIDVQGLGDEAVLRKIGEVLDLHPLALEDAVNVPQRPKSEPYDVQHLFIARMLSVGDRADLDTEQVSLFIGTSYLLTFQERAGDVFDPVRKRIRAGRGPIRRMGPDYLAYALIDTVIDACYPLVEAIGERLYRLEESILERPTPRGLRQVHAMRRNLLLVHRAVWPQREAVGQLARSPLPNLSAEVRAYFRDTDGHIAQIMELADSLREVAVGLTEIFMTQVSHRTNEIMKMLTLMASIFIPLTFIAGIYGMNFENMPELSARLGYPVVLAMMVTVAAGMIAYFRRRGWISRRRRRDGG